MLSKVYIARPLQRQIYATTLRIEALQQRKRLFRPHLQLLLYSTAAKPSMTPRKAVTKRKATPTEDPPSKKAKSDIPAIKDSTAEEEYGIVDREFYPPEMTNARCLQYNANQIERPIEALASAQRDTQKQRDTHKVKDTVVHWFKCDLRTFDNKALHLASKKAKSNGVSLVCVYIVSPQDFKAHMTSPARVDFILRSLEVLKEDLGNFNVPLHVETVEKRKEIPNRIFELCETWGASHLYTNTEYEVDELRREARMTRRGMERGIAIFAEADTCVVAPGELSSGSGGQYAVYSPWRRAWVAYLHQHPYHLNLFDPPTENPSDARKTFADVFNGSIPNAPSNKSLTEEEMRRFRSIWPAGEHEARERLDKFLKQKVKQYKDARNYPAANSTAVVSVHLASGTLSARTAVATARDHNTTQKLDGGDKGIEGWISEVAWRDFYKHVLAHWPYVW